MKHTLEMHLPDPPKAKPNHKFVIHGLGIKGLKPPYYTCYLNGTHWVKHEHAERTSSNCHAYGTYVRTHDSGVPVEVMHLNDREYPAPESEAPAVGTAYYVPEMSHSSGLIETVWHNSDIDKLLLERGQVHLKSDHAIQHYLAIIKAPQPAK